LVYINNEIIHKITEAEAEALSTETRLDFIQVSIEMKELLIEKIQYNHATAGEG